MDDPNEFRPRFVASDPEVQAALDARREQVLQWSGRMPTWSEDVQFAVGFAQGRTARP